MLTDRQISILAWPLALIFLTSAGYVLSCHMDWLYYLILFIAATTVTVFIWGAMAVFGGFEYLRRLNFHSQLHWIKRSLRIRDWDYEEKSYVNTENETLLITYRTDRNSGKMQQYNCLKDKYTTVKKGEVLIYDRKWNLMSTINKLKK